MKNILIIGGGVAGLSAGIFARLNGYGATVCESHSIPGGCLTAWDRGGFHIDNCIHWLTGTNPHSELYKLWKDLDVLGTVDLIKPDTLYTYEYGGEVLSLTRDISELRDKMLSLSPADKKEILSFIKAIETVQCMSGIGGKDHSEKLSALGLITRAPALLKYYKLSVTELAEKFSHPLIQKFISSFLPSDFGALAIIFIAANFCGENGDVPLGGSSSMAQRMTERFLSLGGELLLNKTAVKINLSGKKVTSVSFSDGTEISADHVISTVDPACLFSSLVETDMPKALKKNYMRDALKRFSAFHCAFSCDSPSLPFTDDYVINVPENCKDDIRADNLLVRNSSRGTGCAPKGKSLIQTMAYCREDISLEFINLRKNFKETYAKVKKMIAEAEEKLITDRFPSLKGKLKCIDVWTPASYKRYVRSDIGSFMSFVFPKKYIPAKVSAGVRGLDNLFLAGQWLQTPGGLPIAARSGKDAIKLILRRDSRH